MKEMSLYFAWTDDVGAVERMAINLYDAVKLKNGKKAVVVEVLEAGKACIADVSIAVGWGEDDTILIPQDDIADE